jgi:hypothetical protein
MNYLKYDENKEYFEEQSKKYFEEHFEIFFNEQNTEKFEEQSKNHFKYGKIAIYELTLYLTLRNKTQHCSVLLRSVK